MNPFYWLRILVGEILMRTTGTWIGSYRDDVLPDGSEYKTFVAETTAANVEPDESES